MSGGRGGGDEDKKSHIVLKLISELDGENVFFRVKRSTQLKKLMNAYCDRQTVALNSIVWSYNGIRLQGEQTPDMWEMEDGDEIFGMLR